MRRPKLSRGTGNPNLPWTCREDWAKGEIKSGGGFSAWIAWVFAVWLTVSGMVVAVRGVSGANGVEGGAIVFLLLGAGAGFCLLAIHLTIRRHRFGCSTLRLTTVPGVLGGALAGVIHTERPLRAQDFRLHLGCYEVTTDRDGAREELKWESEKTLRGEVTAGGAGVPVLFQIPHWCPSSAVTGDRRRIVWRLEVTGRTPGTGYHAQFEVPIFRTSQSREDAPALPEPAAGFAKTIDAASLGIIVRPVSGGTEFIFPAARNLQLGLGLGAFTAIWQLFLIIFYNKAEKWFVIVWSAILLLLLHTLIGIWTVRSRLVVGPNGIELTRRWFVFSFHKQIARGDVLEVRPKSALSSGTTTYYDLVAVTDIGKFVKLASLIRGAQESAWLAQEIKKALCG